MIEGWRACRNDQSSIPSLVMISFLAFLAQSSVP